MKIWIAGVLLAAACGSSKESAPAQGSGAAPARPTVTDPLGFCARARLVMLRRQKCFPEDTSIKMGLDSISELETGAPAEPQARRHVAAQCAVMLDGLMRVSQPKNCPLDVIDSERGELTAFLTAWYGERTPAPKTGNADADAAMTMLAAERDAACACKDVSCARSAGTALEEKVADLPTDTPAAAREAALKMVDEAARCRQKLAFGPPAP